MEFHVRAVGRPDEASMPRKCVARQPLQHYVRCVTFNVNDPAVAPSTTKVYSPDETSGITVRVGLEPFADASTDPSGPKTLIRIDLALVKANSADNSPAEVFTVKARLACFLLSTPLKVDVVVETVGLGDAVGVGEVVGEGDTVGVGVGDDVGAGSGGPGVCAERKTESARFQWLAR